MANSQRDRIRIFFYGVRGSIPSSPSPQEIEDKLTWLLHDVARHQLKDDKSINAYLSQLPDYRKNFIGGNTSCVYVQVNGRHIVFDAGSGLRNLGETLMKQEFGKGKGELHLFLSHTHWDHILGFPVFLPAYRSGNHILIYGVHTGLEYRFNTQQEDEFFPVSLSAMGATIEFIQLKKEQECQINGIKITNCMLNHPGGSFGYRLDYNGRSLVYATDSEYKNLPPETIQRYIEFFRNTDVLIFDSQFTIEESIEKENWGHSTSIQGVDFAKEANVKNLFLFHHDPSYSDSKLQGILDEAIRYLNQDHQAPPINIMLARDGLEFVI
jgi:phosphoribosyl 1,2-cyclic phosphodiesterase